METNFSSITDAYRYFSELHGSEHPLRSLEELRDAIHANKLQWGNDEGWERFWNMLFDSEQGQEWLYSETAPDFNPLIGED